MSFTGEGMGANSAEQLTGLPAKPSITHLLSMFTQIDDGKPIENGRTSRPTLICVESILKARGEIDSNSRELLDMADTLKNPTEKDSEQVSKLAVDAGLIATVMGGEAKRWEELKAKLVKLKNELAAITTSVQKDQNSGEAMRRTVYEKLREADLHDLASRYLDGSYEFSSLTDGIDAMIGGMQEEITNLAENHSDIDTLSRKLLDLSDAKRFEEKPVATTIDAIRAILLQTSFNVRDVVFPYFVPDQLAKAREASANRYAA